MVPACFCWEFTLTSLSAVVGGVQNLGNLALGITVGWLPERLKVKGTVGKSAFSPPWPHPSWTQSLMCWPCASPPCHLHLCPGHGPGCPCVFYLLVVPLTWEGNLLLLPGCPQLLQTRLKRHRASRSQVEPGEVCVPCKEGPADPGQRPAPGLPILMLLLFLGDEGLQPGHSCCHTSEHKPPEAGLRRVWAHPCPVPVRSGLPPPRTPQPLPRLSVRARARGKRDQERVVHCPEERQERSPEPV